MNMFESKSVPAEVKEDLDGLAAKVAAVLENRMRDSDTQGQETIQSVKRTFLAYHQSNNPKSYGELEAAIADCPAITRTDMFPINAYLREKLGSDAYAPPAQFGESLMTDLQEIIDDGDVVEAAPEASQSVKN